jgi:vacuolar-type H+-ATPase subunit H
LRPRKPADPRPLEKTAAERLGEIVEAAERAAASVIDDAEAEARRYLAEARLEADRAIADRLADLRGVTDSLIDQADSIRRQSEALLASLEEVLRLLEDEPRRRTRTAHLSAIPPVAEPRLREAGPRPVEVSPRDDGRGPVRGDAAGARLLATQMAVSGAGRGEIEKTLRSGFGIEDPGAILDAILGPEE